MAAPDAIFPCPVFEGSEKRISVTFAAAGARLGPGQQGLRELSRAHGLGLGKARNVIIRTLKALPDAD